jgi:hypothetical protein
VELVGGLLAHASSPFGWPAALVAASNSALVGGTSRHQLTAWTASSAAAWSGAVVRPTPGLPLLVGSSA